METVQNETANQKLIVTKHSKSHSTLQFRYQLSGHQKQIRATVYNPVRHNVVTADDSILILWSLRKELKRFTISPLFNDHNTSLASTVHVAFLSAHDAYLLVTSDGYVRLLTSTLRLLAAFDLLDNRKEKNNAKPTTCAYSQLRNELYVSFDIGIVVAWSIHFSSNSMSSNSIPVPMLSIPKISSEHDFVAVSKQCMLYTYSTEDSEDASKASPEDIRNSSCVCLQVWQERNALFGANPNGECFLWNMDTNTTVAFVKLKQAATTTMKQKTKVPRKLTCFSFSPVSLQLVCGFSNGQVVVLTTVETNWTKVFEEPNYDPEFALIGSFQCHDGPVNSIALASHNSLFYGAISCGDDNQVVHWDTSIGRRLGAYSYSHRDTPNHFPIIGHKQIVLRTTLVNPVRVQVGMLSKQLIQVVVGDLVTVIEVYTPRFIFYNPINSKSTQEQKFVKLCELNTYSSSTVICRTTSSETQLLQPQTGRLLGCISFSSEESSRNVFDHQNKSQTSNLSTLALAYDWAGALLAHVYACSDGHLYIFASYPNVSCLVKTSNTTSTSTRPKQRKLETSEYTAIRAIPSEGTYEFAAVKHRQRALSNSQAYVPIDPDDGEVSRFNNWDGQPGDVPYFEEDVNELQPQQHHRRKLGKKSATDSDRWENGQREIDRELQSKVSSYHIVTGETNGVLSLWKLNVQNCMNRTEHASLENPNVEFIGKLGTHSSKIVAVIHVQPSSLKTKPQNGPCVNVPERESIVTVSDNGLIKAWDFRKRIFLCYILATSQSSTTPNPKQHESLLNCNSSLFEQDFSSSILSQSSNRGHSSSTGLPEVADLSKQSKVSAAIVPWETGIIVVGFENGVIQTYSLPETPGTTEQQSTNDSSTPKSPVFDKTMPLCSVHQHARSITGLTSADKSCEDVYPSSTLVLSCSLDHNVIVWRSFGRQGETGELQSIHCLSFEHPVKAVCFVGDNCNTILVDCESEVLRVVDWKARVRRGFIGPEQLGDVRDIESTDALVSPILADGIVQPGSSVLSTVSHTSLHMLQQSIASSGQSRSELSNPSVQDAYRLRIRLGDQSTDSLDHDRKQAGTTPTWTSRQHSISKQFPESERSLVFEGSVFVNDATDGLEQNPYFESTLTSPTTYSDWQDQRTIDTQPEVMAVLSTLFDNEYKATSASSKQRPSSQSQADDDQQSISVPSAIRVLRSIGTPTSTSSPISDKVRGTGQRTLGETGRWLEGYIRARTESPRRVRFPELISVMNDLNQEGRILGTQKLDVLQTELPKYHKMGHKKSRVLYNSMGEKLKYSFEIDAPKGPLSFHESKELLQWNNKDYKSEYNQFATNGYQEAKLSRGGSRLHKRLFTIARPLPKRIAAVYKKEAQLQLNRLRKESSVGLVLSKAKLQQQEEEVLEIPKLGVSHSHNLIKPSGVIEIVRAICDEYWLLCQTLRGQVRSSKHPKSDGKVVQLDDFIIAWHVRHFGCRSVALERVVNLLNSICAAVEHPLCRLLVHLVGLGMDPPLEPEYTALFALVLEYSYQLADQTEMNCIKGKLIRANELISVLASMFSVFEPSKQLSVQEKASLVHCVSDAVASALRTSSTPGEELIYVERAAEQVLSGWRQWQMNRSICGDEYTLALVSSNAQRNSNQFDLQSTLLTSHANSDTFNAYDRIVTEHEEPPQDEPESQFPLTMNSRRAPVRHARTSAMSKQMKCTLVNKQRRYRKPRQLQSIQVPKTKRKTTSNAIAIGVKQLMRQGHDMYQNIMNVPLEKLGTHALHSRLDYQTLLKSNKVHLNRKNSEGKGLLDPIEFKDNKHQVLQSNTGNQSTLRRDENGSTNQVEQQQLDQYFETISGTGLSSKIPPMKQRSTGDSNHQTNSTVASTQLPNGVVTGPPDSTTYTNQEEQVTGGAESHGIVDAPPKEFVESALNSIPAITSQMSPTHECDSNASELGADFELNNHDIPGEYSPNSSSIQSNSVEGLQLDGPSLNESTTSSVAENRHLEYNWGYHLATRTAASDPTSSATLGSLSTKALMDSLSKPPSAMVGTPVTIQKPQSSPGTRFVVRPKRVQDLSPVGKRSKSNQRGTGLGLGYKPGNAQFSEPWPVDVPSRGSASPSVEIVNDTNIDTPRSADTRVGTPNVVLTDFNRAFVCVTPGDQVDTNKPKLKHLTIQRRHSAPVSGLMNQVIENQRRTSFSVKDGAERLNDMGGVSSALRQVLRRNSSDWHLGTRRQHNSSKKSQRNNLSSTGRRSSSSGSTIKNIKPRNDEEERGRITTVHRASEVAEVCTPVNDADQIEAKVPAVLLADQSNAIETSSLEATEDKNADIGETSDSNELIAPDLPVSSLVDTRKVSLFDSFGSSLEAVEKSEGPNQPPIETKLVEEPELNVPKRVIEHVNIPMKESNVEVAIDETESKTPPQPTRALKRRAVVVPSTPVEEKVSPPPECTEAPECDENLVSDKKEAEADVAIEIEQPDDVIPEADESESQFEDTASEYQVTEAENDDTDTICGEDFENDVVSQVSSTKAKRGSKKGGKKKKGKGKKKGRKSKAKSTKLKAIQQEKLEQEAEELKQRANQLLMPLLNPSNDAESNLKKKRQEELLEKQKQELEEKKRNDAAANKLTAELMGGEDELDQESENKWASGKKCDRRPTKPALLQSSSSRLLWGQGERVATPPIRIPSFKGLCAVPGNVVKTFHNSFTENIKFDPFDLMKQATSIPQWEPNEADPSESDLGSSDFGCDDASENGDMVASSALDDLAFLYQTNDFYTDEWKEWPPLEVAGHFPWQKYFDETKVPEPVREEEAEDDLDREARLLAATKKALRISDDEDQNLVRKTTIRRLNSTRSSKSNMKHDVTRNKLKSVSHKLGVGKDSILGGAQHHEGESIKMPSIEENNQSKVVVEQSLTTSNQVTDVSSPRKMNSSLDEVSQGHQDTATTENGLIDETSQGLSLSETSQENQQWNKLRAAVLFSSQWREDRKARLQRNKCATEIPLFQVFGPEKEGIEASQNLIGFVEDTALPKQYNYYRFKMEEVEGILTIDLDAEVDVDVFLSTKLLPNVTDYMIKAQTYGSQHKQRITLLPGSKVFRKCWYYLGLYSITETNYNLNISYVLHSHTSNELINVSSLTQKFQKIVGSKIVQRNKVMNAILPKKKERKVTVVEQIPSACGEMVSISSDMSVAIPSSDTTIGIHSEEVESLEREIELVEKQLNQLERKKTQVLTYDVEQLMKEDDEDMKGECQNSDDESDVRNQNKQTYHDGSSDSSDSDNDDISSLSDWETESLPTLEPSQWEDNPRSIGLLQVPTGVQYEVGALHTSVHPEHKMGKLVGQFDFTNLIGFENHMKQCLEIFQQATSSTTTSSNGRLPLEGLNQVIRCAGLPIKANEVRNWIRLNRKRVELNNNTNGLNFEGFLEAIHDLTNCARVAGRMKEKLSAKKAKEQQQASLSKQRNHSRIRHNQPRPQFPPHFTDRSSKPRSAHADPIVRSRNVLWVHKLEPGWLVGKNDYRQYRRADSNEVVVDANKFKVVKPPPLSLAIGADAVAQGCDIANLRSPTKARTRKPDFTARLKKSPAELEKTRKRAIRRVKEKGLEDLRAKLLHDRLG